MRSRGFSLAELLISIGLLSVAILAVMALGTTAMSTTRKTTDVSAAQLVASSELQRTLYDALSTGTADPLWAWNNPTTAYGNYRVKVGATDYQVAIYATDIRDTVGNPVGGFSGNRAKKVDVVVSWMGGQGRSGYGLTQTRSTRIVNGP